MRKRRERERERERDLKASGTQCILWSQGTTTEIGSWKSNNTMNALRTCTKGGENASGQRSGERREGKRGEKEKDDSKSREESKEDGSRAVARRNSSLVKGAIIQGIAPGPQTAHKLWAFNLAILTRRSDEWHSESTALSLLRATLGPHPTFFSLSSNRAPNLLRETEFCLLSRSKSSNLERIN